MAKLSNSVEQQSLLHAALEGLLLQKQRIEGQIAQVRSMLGHRGGRVQLAEQNFDLGKLAPKRNLSPEARKRIANAQKKRWAEYRKNAAERQRAAS